jgi:hypothetical protein
MMTSKIRHHDAERFIEIWAPDLAALLLDVWPQLRYAGPRIIDMQPGLLLTAPVGDGARYPAPLNAFLFLSAQGLHTFFADDLVGYARFNAHLRVLDRYCAPFSVDLPGGSQSEARTRHISIDPIFSPFHH